MPSHSTPRHIHLFSKKVADQNARQIEKFSRNVQNEPACLNSSVSMTVNYGNPSAAQDIVWSPPSNPLNDEVNMISGSSSVIGGNRIAIRIPMDGYYSFYFLWSLTGNVTADTDFQVFPLLAKTSQTGFAAPSFGNVPGNLVDVYRVFVNNAANVKWHSVDFRAIQLSANDLIKFQVRTYTTAVGTNTFTVASSEFILDYAIPNGPQ